METEDDEWSWEQQEAKEMDEYELGQQTDQLIASISRINTLLGLNDDEPEKERTQIMADKPNKLIIEVGGDTPKLTLSRAQADTLKIVSSKCYAEFCRRVANGPVPRLADATGYVDDMWPRGLCLYSLDKDTPGMATPFPENIFNLMIAHLKGRHVDIPHPITFGGLAVAKDDTAASIVQRLAALERAAATQPVPAPIDIIEDDEDGNINVDGPERWDAEQDAADKKRRETKSYDMDGRSVKEVAFAKALLGNRFSATKDMMPVDAAKAAGYKRPKAALKRLSKIPVLAEIMADMENAR